VDDNDVGLVALDVRIAVVAQQRATIDIVGDGACAYGVWEDVLASDLVAIYAERAVAIALALLGRHFRCWSGSHAGPDNNVRRRRGTRRVLEVDGAY